MISKGLNWLNERIGFRPALDQARDGAHTMAREAAKYWFEFLKRILILGAFTAVSKGNPLMEFICIVSYVLMMVPIFSWIERYELDFRTRNPKYYVPHLDGEVVTPIPDDQPPAWSYTFWISSLASFVVTLVAVFGGAYLVLSVADTLNGAH